GVPYNSPDVFNRNYAPAGFDRRHTFTIAYSYQLPFGRDAGLNVITALVKDWQVNGIFAAYSGTPFTVTASNAALDQRGNQQTADQVSTPVRVGVGPDQPFYDPSAWAPVTTRRYGTSGRNAYYGPGYWNYNMSLFRRFPLPNRMQLQFRLEGFSITNQPQWSNPISSITDPRFMHIESAQGARSVRLGLRLEF